MTRGVHDGSAPIPSLFARVTIYGHHADVIRATAAVGRMTAQDVIRDLVIAAIESNGTRVNTVRLQIETLLDADRTPIQIAEQLGVTVEYVRTVRRRIRKEREA